MKLAASTLALLSSLPLVACVGGERALSGKCPEGETCSPLTPTGLNFLGNKLADQPLADLFGPLPIARGGTEQIDLEVNADASTNQDARPLTLPYAAGFDVAGILDVAGAEPSRVTVRGLAPGSAKLRITDPADGSLYDRKLLEVYPIAEIELRNVTDQLPDGRAFALSAGPRLVAVALLGKDPSGGPDARLRLADASMRVDLPTGAERPAWDAVSFTADATRDTFRVTAGDLPPVELSVPVLPPTAVERVVALDHQAQVAVNEGAFVCFSAEAQGLAVTGLPWTFTVDGAPAMDAAFANCVIVPTAQPGLRAIVATAAGKQGTASVAVGAAARAPAGDGAGDVPATANPRAGTIQGERALAR